MKKLAYILMTALVLQSCSKKATPTASRPNTPPPMPVAVPMSEETVDASSKTDKGKEGSSTLTAPGKEIYMAKCGNCHGYKDPSNYSRERWVPIMNNMASKAHLTESEKSMVLMYVQANAKK